MLIVKLIVVIIIIGFCLNLLVVVLVKKAFVMVSNSIEAILNLVIVVFELKVN